MLVSGSDACRGFQPVKIAPVLTKLCTGLGPGAGLLVALRLTKLRSITGRSAAAHNDRLVTATENVTGGQH
jgi:hypothetical protein